MTNNKPEAGESFEAAMSQLENIVENMERGELPLEDALTAFENGVKLVRQCEEKLKTAEQKVQILMQSSNKSELQPFDSDGAIANEGATQSQGL